MSGKVAVPLSERRSPGGEKGRGRQIAGAHWVPHGVRSFTPRGMAPACVRIGRVPASTRTWKATDGVRPLTVSPAQSTGPGSDAYGAAGAFAEGRGAASVLRSGALVSAGHCGGRAGAAPLVGSGFRLGPGSGTAREVPRGLPAGLRAAQGPRGAAAVLAVVLGSGRLRVRRRGSTVTGSRSAAAEPPVTAALAPPCAERA